MVTDISTVVGYARVSTDQQGESGAGMDAQAEAITAEATRRGWTLERIYEDVASGKSRDHRPQLAAAIARLDAGEVGTLVVAKLDRLSRSVADFGTIMEEARAGGWNLVVLDLGVDLSTPAGEMVATIMATLAQWERRLISQRTRDALASRRRAGVKLGRPVGVSPDTEGMLLTLRGRGLGAKAIATQMNRLDIPTSQGAARWQASSVRSIFRRLDAEAS